jgi:2-polyprenyl-6-methoxyphenol hydroxylase-like FAD-dependent oxidoreductase
MPGTAFSVVDERLKVLHRTVGAVPDPDDEDPATLSAPANRQTLREVLTAGLDGTLAVSPAADYLMWAVTAPGERFGLPDEQLMARDGAALHGLARDAIAGWHPDLRGLIDRAAAAETFVVRISTSVPVPAWPASRVTLIGDAIHAMSPAGGSGANTALTDAALLRRELAEAARGEKPVLAAIAAYEERMRDYGFAAVAAAGQNLTNRWAWRHPVLARVARLIGRGG